MNDEEYSVTYVIIGDSNIGKTSMANYYVNNKKADEKINETTIGVEFFPYNIIYNNTKLKLNIWDTAGQERYKSIAKCYYRYPHGAFVCFSITKRKTFLNLYSYINDLKELNNKDANIILVGTFSDKQEERTVTKEDIMEFAEKNNLIYIEVSSKTGENIDKCFSIMNKLMYDKFEKENETYQKY